MKHSQEFPTEVLFSFWCFFVLPSGSSALAATFAWWFAAGPWFHRKLSHTFFSLNHLNLKSFSIIYKDLASFSSYILSLDASVRSKLTCLWHVGSLPAWYIQLHLSFKRCLSAWFQQPSPTAQLRESTLRYYKDHWLRDLTLEQLVTLHLFISFVDAPNAIHTVLEVSYNCCQFEFRTIINFCILSMSFRFFCLGQPLMEEIWRNCPQLWALWPGHPAIEPTKLHFFSKLVLFNPFLIYFHASYAFVGLNWCWTLETRRTCMLNRQQFRVISCHLQTLVGIRLKSISHQLFLSFSGDCVYGFPGMTEKRTKGLPCEAHSAKQ